MSQNLEANKSNAIAFYRTAYLGNPREAVEKYVGDELVFSQMVDTKNKLLLG